MMLVFYFIAAVFILYAYNHLANKLCIKKEIPEERQPVVFRWFNVCITIWLISSYVDIFFTH